MQNSKVLQFRVLKGDGEILASLSYPRGTGVWQVTKDVKEKVAKLEGVSKQHILLRSSRGAILQPHSHLDKVLQMPHGDHIVAEFESSNKSGKNKKGVRTTNQNMKVAHKNNATTQNAIMVTESKRTVADREKSSWGSFKIPLRNHSQNDVKEVSSSKQRSSRRDKVTNNGTKRTERSQSVSIGTSSVDHVSTNSALGSLIQNYSNDDDADDEEEDDESGDQDIKVMRRTESKNKRTRADNTDESSQSTDDDSTAESSSKRTRRGENKRNTAESNGKKRTKSESIDKDTSGNSTFSKGVGAFLQHLKSESKKTQSPTIRISASTTKEWPFNKRPLRTYSKKSLNSDTAFIPPASKWDVVSCDEPDSSIVLCDGNNSSSGAAVTRDHHQTPLPPVSSRTRGSIGSANNSIEEIDSFDVELSQGMAETVRDEDDSSTDTPVKKGYPLILPVTPPISSRTRRSIDSADTSIEESYSRDGQSVEEAGGSKVEEEEDDGDDMWQTDVVLLSIQCKGPISNRQLASCINGIFLDLEAESPAKMKALTLDELQKKLESIYQRDLSERSKCIDYVYQKLQRDGPKQRKASPNVVTIGKITLSNEDLYTLADHSWLNDNIINAYMYLLSTSSKKKVFIFSTFFYTNLTKKNKGYDSVKKWTDQIDIFAQDLVLIPVHIRNHWTLAAVHVQQHRIEYYNSLGSSNAKVLGVLMDYLRKEANVRERHLFTALKWDTGNMKGLPLQTNGSDCGVYVCQYAKRICFSKPVKFKSMEALQFRTEMTKELVNKKLKVL